MYTPVSARSAAIYKKVSLESSVDCADPHQLVNLLFEALQRNLAVAKLQLAAGNIAGKCTAIGNAMKILEEGLRAPLDLEKGGEIAKNLDVLYDYCGRQLLTANLKNDAALLDEVLRLIEPIASSWKQIGEKGPAYLRPV